jgi:hypothetical protein
LIGPDWTLRAAACPEIRPIITALSLSRGVIYKAANVLSVGGYKTCHIIHVSFFKLGIIHYFEHFLILILEAKHSQKRMLVWYTAKNVFQTA